MGDCIFCKIISGEIPSFTVYEDSDFKAIMDISPASEGHIIIISKEHVANIFELSDDLASKVMLVTKKIAHVVESELECSGLNILQNNGEDAGQTVFHYHVHIIPRYVGDDVRIKWQAKPGDMDRIKETAAKLIDKLS